jgi:hypothetical protein
MELLKKRIEEIRAMGEEYASGYWTCRTTTDMAEFRVNTPIIYKKEKFKHAVIKIGMILSSLSRLLEQEKIPYHIQTFPLLEDLSIIAVIRFNVNLNRVNEAKGNQIPDTENRHSSLVHYARKRANQFMFELLPVTDANSLDRINPDSDWYLLGSNHNNPFTWLNVGYLAEDLQIHSSADDVKRPQILSGLKLHTLTEKPVVNNSPEYIHAFIGF